MNLKHLFEFHDMARSPNILTKVMIEPTNRCQSNCIPCHRKSRAEGDMVWKTFRETLRQVREIPTIRSINLNFAGEPLLNPDFYSMVELACFIRNAFRMKYKVGFSTNGLLLNKDAADAFVNAVDWININLNRSVLAQEPKRRDSNWEVIKSNLEELLSRPRKKTKISVNMTLNDQTNDDAMQFLELWKGRADAVFLTTSHDENRRIARSNGREVKSEYCWQLKHEIAVLWNGDITTCSGDLRGLNICGNILNNALKNIRKTRNSMQDLRLFESCSLIRFESPR